MNWLALELYLLGMVATADAISLQSGEASRWQKSTFIILWPVMAFGVLALTVLEKFGVEWAARILR